MQAQDPWEIFRDEILELVAASYATRRSVEHTIERQQARIEALAAEVARLRGEAAAPGVAAAAVPDVPWRTVKASALAGLERAYFGQLAEAAGGNVSEIARRASTERSHVRAYLRRHGIAVAGGKPGPQGAVDVATAPEVQ